LVEAYWQTGCGELHINACANSCSPGAAALQTKFPSERILNFMPVQKFFLQWRHDTKAPKK